MSYSSSSLGGACCAPCASSRNPSAPMAASPEDSKAQAGQALLLGVPLAANYALKQKFPSMSSWQRLGIAATLGVLAKNAYSRLG